MALPITLEFDKIKHLPSKGRLNLRIVMLTRFYRNGQTTHVTDLYRELVRQGHEVLLILTQLHDPEYSRWLRQTKVRYITTSNPARIEGYIAKYLPHPHIIHNHSSHTLSVAAALSQLLGIPSVTTVHYLSFRPINLLAKQKAIILISPEMRQVFGRLPANTYVVENGVPIPYPKPVKPWRRKALFLAQATEDKQSNFRSMTESLLAWGWEVSSAGTWRHDKITCHKWVNDVSPLLQEANLVIGTGRAVREAMAWGTPAWVLGAYSDGLVTPENVAELETTNFSGRSSKKAFARDEAALYLENPSPKELHALGEFGHRYASKHFSIQNMAKELFDIYEECIFKCSRKTKPRQE